jgi:NADH:ubiquinone oxidoreductase subunit 6 (subunit J)
MSVNDLLYYIVFFVLAAVTLIAGLLVVTLRNVVHSALALVGALFGVAGLYLLLEAEFLAVVQVLIYVGAISVLILFAIMLTRGLMTSVQTGANTQWAAAALISVFLFGGMLLVAARGPWPVDTQAITTDLVPRLGTLLVTTYVLPFEVVSLLLLGALVGALLIARE